MKNFNFIPLYLFIVIVVFLWGGLFLKQNKFSTALIGKRVPKFSVSMLENNNKKVTHEIFNKKISLLNVWASWCFFCRIEHDLLFDINDLNVQLIGLNYKDEKNNALFYLNNFGNPYMFNIYDGDGNLGTKMGIYDIPEVFIIDENGVIFHRQIGSINKKSWDKYLFPKLKELLK